MKDEDLIRMAEKVPYIYWWNIENYIEQAKSPDTVERLRWIMRRKELHEQIKANGL